MAIRFAIRGCLSAFSEGSLAESLWVCRTVEATMARFLCSVAFVLLALSPVAPSGASPLSIRTENAAEERATPSIVGRETLEEAGPSSGLSQTRPPVR